MLSPSTTDGPSSDGTVHLTTVALPGDTNSEEASAALARLRDDIVPAAFGSTNAEVSVGGQTAFGDDFFSVVNFYTPIVFALVLSLSLFFSKTRTGRALRAVSDDHQAALSVGIPLQHIWAVTWGVAGAIGLIAGVLWGAKLGVHFSLSLLALKAHFVDGQSAEDALQFGLDAGMTRLEPWVRELLELPESDS